MREQGKPQKIIHVIINQIKSPTIIPLHNKAVKSIKLSHFAYLAIFTFLINHYTGKLIQYIIHCIYTGDQSSKKYEFSYFILF